MRILHIIHGFYMGGAETLVKDYLLGTARLDDEYKVLCFNAPYGTVLEQQIQDAGISCVNVRDQAPAWMLGENPLSRLSLRAFIYLAIRREIHRWRPDVIHSHLRVNRYTDFALGKRPFFGHGGQEVRVFFTVHSEPSVFWAMGNGGRRDYRIRADFCAAKRLVKYHRMRFIALHDRMREEINRLFGVDNTVVINNGIDFGRFETLRPAAELRAELGIPEDAFLVGHVGRMTPAKNHEKILSVFREILGRAPNAYLLLVGSGELEAELRKTIAALELQEHTLILHNRSDVPDLLNAMDVFLFPSRCEGLGIALIEAQKAGLPCVISDAVPEHAVISNHVRIKRLSEEDAAWADAVLEKYSEPIEYKELEEWDMQHTIKKLLALYHGQI